MKYPNIKNIKHVKHYLNNEQNINNISKFLIKNPNFIKFFTRREVVNIPNKDQEKIYQEIGNDLFRVELIEYDKKILSIFLQEYFGSIDINNTCDKLKQIIKYIKQMKQYEEVARSYGMNVSTFEHDYFAKFEYTSFYSSLIDKKIYKIKDIEIINSLLKKEIIEQILEKNNELIKVLFLIDYCNFLLYNSNINYELYYKHISGIKQIIDSFNDIIDIKNLDSAFVVLMSL